MRDPETGKGGYVPSDMTYQEWKEIYIDKTSTMEEWEKKHEALKMSSSVTSLPRQKPTSHTTDEYAEIVKYADDRGINIFQVERFDGDTTVLYDQIDALYETRKEYNLTKKLTIRFDDLYSGDLAITSHEGTSIVFDRNALRNRKATNEYLASDNYLATNDVKGIGYHEAGHLITNRYGEKGFDIAEKLYYNKYRKMLSVNELLDNLEADVSQYSVRLAEDKKDKPFKKKYYKEITAEMYSQFKTNQTDVSSAFISLLRREIGV